MTDHYCTGDCDTCPTCNRRRDAIEWETGPFANTGDDR